LDGATLSDYLANTDGVSNLIEAIQLQPDVRRTIFASSRMVCRIGYQPGHDHDYCPTTVYGESKVEGERRIYSASGLLSSWIIVRPTSLWGPWFDVPYRGFFDAISKGYYFHPKGRRIRKSFGYVGNAVVQLDKLMFCESAGVGGRMFYLCDRPPLDVHVFAETIRDAFGAPPIRSVPMGILRVMATIGDTLRYVGLSNPPLTSFRLRNLLTEMIHDNPELEAISGPPKYSLEEGVSATVEWIRAVRGRDQKLTNAAQRLTMNKRR
jgi:nucleoside-diphosphate-sugar epimerase